MANIKIDLPCEPFSEQIVTFTALCDCSQIEHGLIINGETYVVCDSLGRCVTGEAGAWAAGAKISVMLDCENKKAYILNAAGSKVTCASIGAASAERLQSHIEDTANPHKVIASQVLVSEAVKEVFSDTAEDNVDDILLTMGTMLADRTTTIYRWKKTKIVWEPRQDTGSIIGWCSNGSTHRWDVDYDAGSSFYDNRDSATSTWANTYLNEPIVHGKLTYTTRHTGSDAGQNTHTCPALLDKYVSNLDFNNGNTRTGYVYSDIYFVSRYDPNQKIHGSNGEYYYYSHTICGTRHYYEKVTTTETVTSTDPLAHYDGEVDDEGFTYTAIEPITSANKIAKIATGEYQGTGTYGSTNALSIVCEFAPKFVFIIGKNSSNYMSVAFITPHGGYCAQANSGGNRYWYNLVTSVEGNSIYWYSSNNSADYQQNQSNYTYNWIAWG